MSIIDKMTIMGIRSFGIRDEDKQLIEFEHPLTLIVGQNGAGKTTVIECLKYVTTGDQPANTKGGAFVHDPKLVGESEVRAQVGLRFSDQQGRECTIKRSLQVTQKEGKATLKSLDGIITKVKDDEKVSISSKCADLSSEMVMSLGVSKAVLENVIFCHQEDSNWPLSDGKTLKQKFDDIFAATRYIKSLDLLKAARKDKMAQNKNEETHLLYLERLKMTAEEKRESLRENESKLNIAREGAKQVEKKIEPLEKRLKDMTKIREETMAMDRQLGENSSRLEQMKADRNRLVERIKNLFHGSDEQLFQLQKGQEKLLETKRKKQEECESQVKPLQRKMTSMSDQINALTLRQGKLQQESESIQSRRKELAGLLVKCCEKHKICEGMVNPDQELPDESADYFESEIGRLIKSENQSMNQKRKKLDADVASCEREIQDLWQTKAELEEGIKHKQHDAQDKQKKIESLSREIVNLESASDVNRLSILQKQLEQSENDLRMAEESDDTKQLKVEVKSLLQEKVEQEQKLEKVEEEIVTMQKHAQIKTTLELLKKDHRAKDDLLRRIKFRIADSLRSVNLLGDGTAIDQLVFPTRQILSGWISRKEDEVKGTRKNLDKKKQELAKLTTKYDMLTKQLAQKTARCKEIDEKMFEFGGSENFEDDLTQLESEIKELQGSKGLTDGIQFMYKEFLKKLQSSAQYQNTPCPLCHRLFDQPQEVEELAQEVAKKLELAPQKTLSQEQELDRKQIQYKQLLQHIPDKKEMDKLQSTVVPELQNQVSELKAKITEVRRAVAEQERSLEKVQNDETTAKSCTSDIAQIDTILREMKDLTRRIGATEAQLPGGDDSDKTFDSLNSQKQDLLKTVQKFRKDIEEKREQIETHTNMLLKLREIVNSVQSEKLELASDAQKCRQFKETRKAMAEELKQIKQQINQSRNDAKPLQSELAVREKRKEDILQHRENQMNTMTEAIQSLKEMLREISTLNDGIKKYASSGRAERLLEVQTAVRKLETELAGHENELTCLRDEIERLQKDLATCKERQRDLDDNMALRKQDEAVGSAEKEVAELKEKLEGMDSRKMERESSELSKQWHSLSKEKERCVTRAEGFLEIDASLRKELEKDELKNADERYRNSLIKVTITKLATDDLLKYHNALDRAIMRYHHLKMVEINKSVKEIWRDTYRGHDIDYIEICSDEDTKTSSSTRRVYNYRLVKCCQGVKTDMRGRCSAGQKVLASIVIRLALAETFCINCGILALDEPTTNLDRDHIESLAHALISITQQREAQRNFQLIIITHDEDFVELLGRSQYADHFFRVAKVDGKSRITRCPIQAINE